MDVIRIIEVKEIGPELIPIEESSKIVRLDHIAGRILRIIRIKATLAFVRIAIGSEAHGFALAIAMYPAQRLRDVAVKPSQRSIYAEFFERAYLSVLGSPKADRIPISHTVAGDNQRLFMPVESTR